MIFSSLVDSSAAADKPLPVYALHAIVRARCNGGDDFAHLGLYDSARHAAQLYDPVMPLPRETRLIRAGTLLRVIAAKRFQTYTFNRTPALNIQILEVEPIHGVRWRAYTDSLFVDPPSGPRDPTNSCL